MSVSTGEIKPLFVLVTIVTNPESDGNFKIGMLSLEYKEKGNYPKGISIPLTTV